MGLGRMLSRSTANEELHEWNVTLAVGRVASLMKHTWRTTVCGVAGTWNCCEPTTATPLPGTRSILSCRQ